MPLFDLVTRAAFARASIALMLRAGALIFFAGVQVVDAYRQADADVGSTLLEAVGYTVIASAVFDVGKYLLEEEEAIRAREMRQTREARRSMTEISTMVYPTLLLFGGVALMIGLGAYQGPSADVEKDVSAIDAREEKKADDAAPQPLSGENADPAKDHA